MGLGDRWIDLLDPTLAELRDRLPADIHGRALEQLCAPAQHDDEPRPKLESHGDYIFGVFLVAVAVRDEDLVYYQEVDLVMTRHVLVTVRKTPEGGRPPFDPTSAMEACRASESIAMIDYHQAKVANDQNEVMKRLTVVASILLVPTLIAGIYGQNFDNIPELHWWWGYYGWSWGLIVVSTIIQLAFFKWRKWF